MHGVTGGVAADVRGERLKLMMKMEVGKGRRIK